MGSSQIFTAFIEGEPPCPHFGEHEEPPRNGEGLEEIVFLKVSLRMVGREEEEPVHRHIRDEKEDREDCRRGARLVTQDDRDHGKSHEDAPDHPKDRGMATYERKKEERDEDSSHELHIGEP